MDWQALSGKTLRYFMKKEIWWKLVARREAKF